jgi:hypothetical protein
LRIETVFLIIFFIGIIAIPLLYWLSTRGAEHVQGRRATKREPQLQQKPLTEEKSQSPDK